jgi:hypothetical protein
MESTTIEKRKALNVTFALTATSCSIVQEMNLHKKRAAKPMAALETLNPWDREKGTQDE